MEWALRPKMDEFDEAERRKEAERLGIDYDAFERATSGLAALGMLVLRHGAVAVDQALGR